MMMMMIALSTKLKNLLKQMNLYSQTTVGVDVGRQTFGYSTKYNSY